MRVAIASTFVPFAADPYRALALELEEALRLEGHQTEVVWLPQVDTPELLIPQVLAFRLVELEQVDRLICLRPQSHVIAHPNKVVWLTESLLAGTEKWCFNGFPVDSARAMGQLDAVRSSDTLSLNEAKTVFVGSTALKTKLLTEHSVGSILLPPPVILPASNNNVSNTIISLSSYDENSRLHIIIEAIALASSSLNLRVFGDGCHPDYAQLLDQLILRLGIGRRVFLDFGPTPEEVVAKALRECLAVVDLKQGQATPGDSIARSIRSAKCVIVSNDGGVVLDEVFDGLTGVVVEPEVAGVTSTLRSLEAGKIDHVSLGATLNARAREMSSFWPETLKLLLK